MVRPPDGVQAPPGAAFGAGSPLPFPLRPAEFHLCRMPRGRCVSTRPHLCLREQPTRIHYISCLAILAKPHNHNLRWESSSGPCARSEG